MKKSKYYLGTPMLKKEIALNIICQRNIQCPVLLCFEVYTPTQYALSCKIPIFKFYVNRKTSKYYLGTPMLKTKAL